MRAERTGWTLSRRWALATGGPAPRGASWAPARTVGPCAVARSGGVPLLVRLLLRRHLRQRRREVPVEVEVLDHVDEPVELDGLLDVRVRVVRVGADDVLVALARREHDHGDVARLRVALDRSE